MQDRSLIRDRCILSYELEAKCARSHAFTACHKVDEIFAILCANGNESEAFEKFSPLQCVPMYCITPMDRKLPPVKPILA